MSNDYYSENRTTSLVFWATGQMAKGMLYALVFVLAIGVALGVIYGISQLLPEASKQGPSPYSALIVDTLTRVA